MKTRTRVCFLVALLVLISIIIYGSVQSQTYRVTREINLGKINYSMTADEVKRAIGRPDHVNQYGGTRGTTEQWVYYEQKTDLFLYFDNGVFTSYQRMAR